MTLKKLFELATGESGKIKEILKYRNENECMGISPDMQIEVLPHDPAKGPCIIRTEQSQREIVMTREMAAHILVETG